MFAATINGKKKGERPLEKKNPCKLIERASVMSGRAHPKLHSAFYPIMCIIAKSFLAFILALALATLQRWVMWQRHCSSVTQVYSPPEWYVCFVLFFLTCMHHIQNKHILKNKKKRKKKKENTDFALKSKHTPLLPSSLDATGEPPWYASNLSLTHRTESTPFTPPRALLVCLRVPSYNSYTRSEFQLKLLDGAEEQKQV